MYCYVDVDWGQSSWTDRFLGLVDKVTRESSRA